MSRRKFPFDQLYAVLQAAMSEPIGIVIKVNDIQQTKMDLYKCRKMAIEKYGDAELQTLQIRTSPFPEGQLLICHSRRVPQPKGATNLTTLDLGQVLNLNELDE